MSQMLETAGNDMASIDYEKISWTLENLGIELEEVTISVDSKRK